MKKLQVVGIREADSNYNYMLLNNDAIAQDMLTGKKWEPHITEFCNLFLKTGDTALDVGANFGYHTVHMAHLVSNSGVVYAFEPLRVIYQQLNTNVFVNGLDNVVSINSALSNTIGKTYISSVDYHSTNKINIGASSLTGGGQEVSLITLDSLNIPNVKFMKIDIQGSEMRFLTGASKTIKKYRPVFIIEIEECFLKMFKTSSEDLINYILAQGYLMYRINSDYPCDHIAVPLDREKEIDSILENYNYDVFKIKGSKVKLHISNGIIYDRIEIKD